MQHPRGKLLLVALAALGSLAALVAARPPLGPAVWARGDDLALAVAWVVAVAAGAWLFAATGTCLIALGIARPRLARRLAPMLPIGLRRLVEVAIVASCVAVPALPASATPAAPAAPAAVIVDQPVVRVGASSPAAARPVATAAPGPRSTPRPVAPTAPARAGTERRLPAGRVLVRAGDNLWLIARAALTNGVAGRPSEQEVAHYWRAVVAANRTTLRSGDPSLIFPGEMIALPPATVVS